ncbi:MAG: TetR/AcrR family transcriptional regulator [Anaerolineae bacterium]
MKTKERILDAALALFNEQGTGPVSTNHIAQAAGISPGNLYYHFENKEAIVRALFERLFHQWDIALNLPDDRGPTQQDVENLIRTNFAIMSQYTFIYRELIALLRGDPELQQRFLIVRERGYQGFRAIIEYFVRTGVLVSPGDEVAVTRLADLCWLISEFWMATVEISGHAIDDAQLERGVALMRQVLQPYLS